MPLVITAREISCNNFEISLLVFMPNITSNHAITYTGNVVAERRKQVLSGKCFHEQLAQLFFTNLMYQTKVAPPLTDTFCQQTLPISQFHPRAHTVSSPSEDTCAITGGSIVSSSMLELSPSSADKMHL